MESDTSLNQAASPEATCPSSAHDLIIIPPRRPTTAVDPSIQAGPRPFMIFIQECGQTHGTATRDCGDDLGRRRVAAAVHSAALKTCDRSICTALFWIERTRTHTISTATVSSATLSSSSSSLPPDSQFPTSSQKELLASAAPSARSVQYGAGDALALQRLGGRQGVGRHCGAVHKGRTMLQCGRTDAIHLRGGWVAVSGQTFQRPDPSSSK